MSVLRRAGAPLDVEERRMLSLSGDEEGMLLEVEFGETVDLKTTATTEKREQQAVFPDGDCQQRPSAEVRRMRLFSPGQLLIDGQPVLVVGTGTPQPTSNGKSTGAARSGNGPTHSENRGYAGHTDLEALNRVGIRVALSFERNRLRHSGLNNAGILDSAHSVPQPDALVFDVSSPDKIARARELAPLFDTAMQHLRKVFGISLEWPGFDVLTLDPRVPDRLDRLIELKSSGVKSRVQEMGWNEVPVGYLVVVYTMREQGQGTPTRGRKRPVSAPGGR